MSVLNKKWIIKNTGKNKSAFEKILENRQFLTSSELNDFHDPFLFEDMEKACERIEKAIQNRERIIVFGDYDLDGISGTAILVHTLRLLKAEVSYRLPHRVDDGYGLSGKFIDEFIEKKIQLIITVDCGISCGKEIKKAAAHGIDTIITDHHTIPESKPEARAILHPKIPNTKYPFTELTGAGVALKLAHALLIRNHSDHHDFLHSLVDLATLGTIADLGALVGENRLIVKKGLRNLANTKWPGLRQIMNLANIKPGVALDTVKIGFQIAPRLNAAGRIGDPYTALSLLLQREENPQIELLGRHLEELNSKRQDLTKKAFEEMEQDLSKSRELPHMLIAHHTDWHVGILGLVAGKLAEKYSRPAIIMQDFGDTLVASARSPKHFNIVDAIKHCSELLVSFGGHAQAAGLNLKKKNLAAFKEKILNYTREKLQNTDLQATLEIDCEIQSGEINLQFLDKIEALAPFGMGNEKPIFILRDVEPFFIDNVGSNGDHMKFLAKVHGKNIEVIAFRLGNFSSQLRKHRKIDLVCHLEKNSWQDQTTIQLQALDFQLKG